MRCREYGVMALRRRRRSSDAAVVAGGDRSLQGTEHPHPQWLLERISPDTGVAGDVARLRTRRMAPRDMQSKPVREAIAGPCHLTRRARTGCCSRRTALAAEGLRVLGRGAGRTAAGCAGAAAALMTTTRTARADRLEGPAARRRAAGRGRAVRACRGHGEGDDHRRPLATAFAIARQAGIATAAGAPTGIWPSRRRRHG